MIKFIYSQKSYRINICCIFQNLTYGLNCGRISNKPKRFLIATAISCISIQFEWYSIWQQKTRKSWTPTYIIGHYNPSGFLTYFLTPKAEQDQWNTLMAIFYDYSASYHPIVYPINSTALNKWQKARWYQLLKICILHVNNIHA